MNYSLDEIDLGLGTKMSHLDPFLVPLLREIALAGVLITDPHGSGDLARDPRISLRDPQDLGKIEKKNNKICEFYIPATTNAFIKCMRVSERFKKTFRSFILHFANFSCKFSVVPRSMDLARSADLGNFCEIPRSWRICNQNACQRLLSNL